MPTLTWILVWAPALNNSHPNLDADVSSVQHHSADISASSSSAPIPPEIQPISPVRQTGTHTHAHKPPSSVTGAAAYLRVVPGDVQLHVGQDVARLVNMLDGQLHSVHDAPAQRALVVSSIAPSVPRGQREEAGYVDVLLFLALAAGGGHRCQQQ